MPHRLQMPSRLPPATSVPFNPLLSGSCSLLGQPVTAQHGMNHLNFESFNRQAQFHMQKLLQLQAMQAQMQRGLYPHLASRVPLQQASSEPTRTGFSPQNTASPSRLNTSSSPRLITVEELEASLLSMDVSAEMKGGISDSRVESRASAGNGNNSNPHFENGVFICNGDTALDGSLEGSDQEDT
ncbi:hypothetical protein QYM36_016439 [Artemia franciscana]|uniref:Uncharacterized protein n=1 Tax=Artemia franciscana TaxID=6661 RepID=A0AA88L3F2_ARTSF|nr:hypothetical protein QYM36_016439 [Artemia franciscana]